MSKGFGFFFLAFFIALVSLYLFGQTKPKKIRDQSKVDVTTSNTSTFDFHSYRQNVISNVDSSLHLRTSDLLSSIDDVLPEPERLMALRELVSIFDMLNSAVSAYYQSQIASITGEKDDWIAAGDRYTNILGIIDNPSIIGDLKDRALASFGNALQMDSSDIGVRVRMANVYLESGDDQIMKGVQSLLSVLEEHPDNPEANLLLGKFGIISRQYDKAIVRLEKVVSSQPQNAEALFLLAEAYKGTGRVEDAVVTLEKCKLYVGDDQLAAEIDAYIEKLR